MRCVDVAVGIVMRHGQVLITRRREGGSFAGFWEFPGGKREAGETIEQCLVREMWEEIELPITAVRALEVVEHAYPTATVRLHPFLCRDADPASPPAPKLICVAEARWIDPAQLREYQFPPANDPLIQKVMAACTQQPKS